MKEAVRQWSNLEEEFHELITTGPRCNGGVGGGAALSTCLCMHAEENALLEAGRERIRDSATLYCDTWVAHLNSHETMLIDAADVLV